MSKLTDELESGYLKKEVPDFRAGDSVQVHAKITEEGKTRIQVFEGVVIRKRGRGLNSTFIVRKISYGEGVERVFPLHSPLVDKIVVTRRGKVRRAGLYHLRKKIGRSARVKTKESKYTS